MTTRNKDYNFSRLKGELISVLIVGKDRKKESYKGIVDGVEGNFLVLKTLKSSYFPLKQVIIRTDIIESVWIYKEKEVDAP